jgi:hypothetical protein
MKKVYAVAIWLLKRESKQGKGNGSPFCTGDASTDTSRASSCRWALLAPAHVL